MTAIPSLQNRLHHTPLIVYLKATVVLMALGLVIKLLGAIHQALLAALFGIGPELDAYYAAVAVPNVLITFFILGPLGLSLTSSVVKAGGSLNAVAPLIRATTTLAFGSSLALAVAGYVAAPWIISALAPGFAQETSQLAVALFRMLAPAVVVASLSALARSVLHAYQRFLVPMAAYGLGSAVSIAVLATFGQQLGVEAAAAGVLAGSVAGCSLLWWAARRQGISCFPTWPVSLDALSGIIGPLCLLGLALVALQGIALWGRFYASQLGPGSLALLDYGLSLDKLAGGLVAGSAATAAYPTVLAQAVAGPNSPPAGVRRILRGALLAALPLVILLTVLREPLLLLWLQRGRFTPQDTAAVAELVLLLAPAFVSWSMAYPVLYAAHAVGRLRLLPPAVSLLGFCSAGPLGLLLMEGWGLRGVAMAISVSACATVVALFALLARDIPGLWNRRAAAFVAKLGLSALVAAAGASLSPAGLPLIVQLCLGAAAGGALYVAALYSLGVEEAVAGWNWVRRTRRAAAP